jgi:hypothetical protein
LAVAKGHFVHRVLTVKFGAEQATSSEGGGMESDKKDGTTQLAHLLQTLIDSVKASQIHNQQILSNHAEAIKNNRDTCEALAAMLNQQSKLFNITRGVVLKLWEESHPDEPSTQEPVN